MTESVDLEVSRLQELVYVLKIEEVMKQDVITVTPQASMRELKEVLRLKRISGTPVMEGDRLVGVISLEDLIKALEKGEMDTAVGSRMSTQIEVLHADEPVIQAINKMARFGYGRFPVVNREGRLVGILTRGDILRGLLRRVEVSAREEEIHRYRASHIFEDIVSNRTSLMLRYQVKGKDFSGGGSASSKIKRAIERLGGSPQIARRVGVAAYEAEMNLVIHTTSGGEMLVEVQPDQVWMMALDHGPGIPDVEQALRPGFSTAPEWIREMGFGAGMGLLNIQHCADQMNLESQVDIGTRLEMWFRIPSPAAPAAEKENVS